jgi:hypothetical protein
MRTFSFSLAVAVIVPALACEVETLDVGLNAAGSAGTNAGGTAGTSNPEDTGYGGEGPPEPLPSPPSRTCDTDAAFEKFVGVWEGVEADFLFQPIRPVHLEIRSAGSSGVCGSFLHGELNAPPPATDPNADYPPSPWHGKASRRDALTGVPYEITAGGARGDLLRFSISGYELWKDWCALQDPVFDPEGNVSPECVQHGDLGNSLVDDGTCTINTDFGPYTYPYFKCRLCHPAAMSVCSCNASGCWSKTDRTTDHEFTLSEEDGVPTLTAATGSRTQLRLQRRE